MRSFLYRIRLLSGLRASVAAAVAVFVLAGAANAASHFECSVEPTRLFDKDGISRGLFNVEVCKWKTPPVTDPATQAEAKMVPLNVAP